jgi:putative oxidoreductase
MTARSAELGERISLTVRLYQAIALLDCFPPSILQLMFRVAIAAVFWSSGLTKIASWDTTIALFRDEYMVPLLPPELAAVMSATFELSCSALIVIGLATRLATLPLLGMTFVIEAFVYPEYWSMHLMWATVLLFLLTKGPGAFSLDHYAGRILRTKEILRVSDRFLEKTRGLSRARRRCRGPTAEASGRASCRSASTGSSRSKVWAASSVDWPRAAE